MAIEILEGLDRTAQPTDRFLKDWFRIRRFAGSKDRRAIAEQVFSVQRHRARLGHRMGSDAPRALVIAALVEAGEDVAALFTGGYGPAPLTDAERAAIAAAPPPAPAWVLGEYPQWLEPELIRAFGDRLPQAMAALIPRAPVDLARQHAEGHTRRCDCRAERTTASQPRPRLTRRTASASRTRRPICPARPCLNPAPLNSRTRRRRSLPVLCHAAPGMRVLDLAAGAGGKSLALAAAMQNPGEIVACDVRGEALFELEKRAARAGVTIIKTLPLEHAAPEGLFDLVLVDAPCSGTRHLAAPARIALAADPGPAGGTDRNPGPAAGPGRGADRPGGRLVYATCSILPVENQDRADAFRPAGRIFRL